MPFYRRFSEIQAASSSRGSAADAPDASLRLTENFLSAGGFKPTAGDRIKAVQAFQEALTGKTSFAETPELPPLEMTTDIPAPGDRHGYTFGMDASSIGSDLARQMNGLMLSVMDVAMKLANPLEFIGAICEFLITLFAAVGNDFTQALQQIDAYNQAAQAALDSEKLVSQIAAE
ncbi:MAG: hypothetical protein C0507_25425 [Cyanobacteria bacterium PR.3.49]|nr:hypothetical protein [Cyanobacteria bacterium PR.3.49]